MYQAHCEMTLRSARSDSDPSQEWRKHLRSPPLRHFSARSQHCAQICCASVLISLIGLNEPHEMRTVKFVHSSRSFVLCSTSSGMWSDPEKSGENWDAAWWCGSQRCTGPLPTGGKVSWSSMTKSVAWWTNPIVCCHCFGFPFTHLYLVNSPWEAIILRPRAVRRFEPTVLYCSHQDRGFQDGRAQRTGLYLKYTGLISWTPQSTLKKVSG